jgi:dihydroorotase
MDSAVMLRAMQSALALGLPVISHCEELTLSAGGVVHAGPVGYRMGLPTISTNSEAIMVAREILLQQEVGGKVHLAHLSSRQSVELLKAAKEKGAGITAEVTPHHLLLTENAIENFNANAKMNPPLRTVEDRDSLLEALQQGIIDCVATDHAPHRPEEKEDFLNAPFGVIGLETALPLLWTKLVESGLLTPARFVTSFSTAPARILNIPGGTLAPGSPADLTVFDPQGEYIVEAKDFYSLGRNTPFQGWRLQGLPILTMVGGDIKMWKGRVKGFSRDFSSELEKELYK